MKTTKEKKNMTAPEKMTMTSEALSLKENSCNSPYGEYTIAEIPERYPVLPLKLNGTTPLIEKLFRGALFDVESNIVYNDDWRYLAAGKRGTGWRGVIFVRDVTFSGLLGLHDFYPYVMRDAYAYMRDRMLVAGRKNPACHKIEGYDDEIVAQTHDEFKTMGFNTPPFARWTDGMNTVWGMWDLLQKMQAGEKEIREVYNFAKHIYEWLFVPLYDPADGLYRGQPSFVDIGLNGYPESFGRNLPRRSETDSPGIYNRALQIKATSTNCIHVLAFNALSEMAQSLGMAEDAQNWKQKRDTLIETIRNELRFKNGTFSYFKHENGELEPRQHALGTAFAILSDTVKGEDAAEAIRDYPITDKGVPLHSPFYDNKQTYHNNSSWPFVDAFFLWAREKALNVDESARHFALLASVYKDGSFHEVTNHLTNEISGYAQLWTAAPFLGRCKRSGQNIVWDEKHVPFL
jgi:hypothetical protein